MPSELDLTTLGEEVALLDRAEHSHWNVQQVEGALRVYASFRPAKSDDTLCLRLDFGSSLSSGPPSVTFCDPETHAEGQRRDWPKGLTEYFKPPPKNGAGWICNPWTQEGRHHHQEWKDHAWPNKRHVWRVVTAIQDILDRKGAYTGRLDEL